MKQYDFVRAWKNDADFDIEGPVIVLTMAELKDLWVAAQLRTLEIGKMAMREEVGLPDPNLYPNFTTYLTSKGIQL